jgi:ubiquinone/menaquinone biosynthesis C-methylase UbiE
MIMESTAVFAGIIPENYERYLGPFLFEPYALDLVSRTQDKKYPDILELACGTGRVTNHLADSVEYDTLTATDLNPDMIKIAKTKVSNDSIKWMTADGLDLPFPDASFDLVVCQFGFMFFPDKEKGFKEAFRVLKPSGKLIFNTWDKIENNPPIYMGSRIIESYFGDNSPMFYKIPFSMYDEKEMLSLVSQAGFRKIKISLVEKEGITSTSDLATGLVKGNPVYLALHERDPSLIETIKEHVRKELANKYGEGQLKSKLHAWVGEAEK